MGKTQIKIIALTVLKAFEVKFLKPTKYKKGFSSANENLSVEHNKTSECLKVFPVENEWSIGR